MRWACILFLTLGACNTANPIDRLDRSALAEAGGHTFRVNWNLKQAQVTRTDRAWRPGVTEVILAAVQATEQVTGCSVIPGTALGDIALVNMRLDCST